MAPLHIIGVMTCLTALASTYGGFYYRTRPTPSAAATPVQQSKARELKTITVPMIRDGHIRGYVSAEFSIIAAEINPHQENPEIDSYVLDEAYRLIYADNGLDFQAIQKTDLNRLTADIKLRVNTRLNREAIQDVHVRGFHYVPREQAFN